MRISFSIVLLFTCSSLLFHVGLGRFNPSNADQPVEHPKAVSKFWLSFGPLLPGEALLPPPPAARTEKPPTVPAPPTWKPPTDEDIQKCWSTFSSMGKCVAGIADAFFSFDYSRVGHDCCLAIVGIDDNCYGKMFGHFNNGYLAPELRQSCAQRSLPNAPPKALPPPQVPAPPAWKPPTNEDYQKCWASLGTIDRCAIDIVAALLNLDFSRVGSHCCAAIEGIDENCTGTLFDQFNSRYYAPALRQNCAQRSQPKAPSQA